MSNGNEPAYPCSRTESNVDGGRYEHEYPGLTKRERIAMEMAAAFIQRTDGPWTDAAATGCNVADALLAELEKRDEPASSENVS